MDESWQRTQSPPASEQRRKPRQSLLMLGELRFGSGGPAAEVRIRNISAGGALVSCRSCPGTGEAVTLTIKGIGEVSGTVLRSSSSTVAITFDQPIDLAAVQLQPPKRDVRILHHVADPRRPGLTIK